MSEQQQERSQESLRHEYTEVALNIRHYGNLRFAVFSVFIAMMAGVGIVAFGKGQFDEHAAEMARNAGFPVIAIFWVYEERISRFFDHYTRVAIELERSLGYTQYTTRPVMPRYLPETRVVVRIFFFFVTLLWLYAAFAVPLNR
jgi:hypothetical protein